MKILFFPIVSFLLFTSVFYVGYLFANGYSYQRREKALEERTNHFIEKQVQSKEFQKKQKIFKRRVIDIHRAKHYVPPQLQQQQSQAQTKQKEEGTKDQKANPATSTGTKKKKP